MKNFHKKLIFPIILTLAAVFLIPSCELKDPDDYEIMIIVMGNGSTTPGDIADPLYPTYNKFSTTILVDGKPPLPFISPDVFPPERSTLLIIPAGKIKTATITAQRINSDSTLMIMIYKDNELDEKGVGLLPTCTSTLTSSCSNTLNLIYKVDEDDPDDTEGASASSSSSSSE
ncbi:MAG: hypothetical protein JXA07_16570 [Spirochaetes bacterium]|nr:hypothetical protein [Spirochaetota bacterium]